MKKTVIILMSLCLVFTPCLMLAASAAGNTQRNEIEALNKLGKGLLTQSGGKCWQTCADDDYGKLNCVTTCDEDGATGPASGGGSNLFSTPEGLILGTVLLVGIIAFVWYMADQSNAANGV